jgi:uncharacterized iron-regulated membrane protein
MESGSARVTNLWQVLLRLALAAAALSWSAYAFESFGSIVPNTNAAKRGGALSR